LLTAWSMAGILGPVLVNYIREFQIARGVPNAQAYNTTMYILAALLVIGFFSNLAVKPVAERYYMTDAELAAERQLADEVAARKGWGKHDDNRNQRRVASEPCQLGARRRGLDPGGDSAGVGDLQDAANGCRAVPVGGKACLAP